MRRLSIVALTICGLCVSLLCKAQTDVSATVARLQNPVSSDDAMKEIEGSTQEVKSAIAEKLPNLIANEKNDVVLNNEVSLAGKLKDVGCVPILVRIFVKGDLLPNGVTETMRWHMVNDPAGHALVQIGDPVIPFMNKLLTSEQRDTREKAVRVLGNINSPAALDALRQHRPSEQDKYLQHVIDSVAPQN